jgi:hypothetical protein
MTAPRTFRQQLVADLEDLGYDTARDTPSQWRDSLSDQDLLAAIMGYGIDVSDLRAPAAGCPDIGEMVAAIREHCAAADAFNDAHPEATSTPDDATGRRWIASLDALRSILSTIEDHGHAA